MKKYLLITIILAGLFTGACGDSESSGSAADTGQSGETVELTWYHDDFESASAEAEETGKPLLIDMYADWCGPCRTLGEQYFTSDEMHEILSGFVLLRLDVDNPAMASYAQHYNVSAIPCVVIAQADGTEIDRIVGTTPTIAQYITALEEIYSSI